MVDPTEGYHRMKSKLVRNPHGSKHAMISRISQTVRDDDKSSKDELDDTVSEATVVSQTPLRKKER